MPGATEDENGNPSGTENPATPATLEEALARIADLETERGTLRKENATHRRKNNSIQADADALAEKVKELEGKQIAGTQNGQEVLESRAAEIAALKAQLAERDEKLAGYADVEETERTKLLERLPETKRAVLKGVSLDALRVIVEDVVSQQRESPGGGASDGRDAGNVTLEAAVASGDQKTIREAFVRQLEAEKAGPRPTTGAPVVAATPTK